MVMHQFIVQADQEREDDFSRAMVATDDLACAHPAIDENGNYQTLLTSPTCNRMYVFSMTSK